MKKEIVKIRCPRLNENMPVGGGSGQAAGAGVEALIEFCVQDGAGGEKPSTVPIRIMCRGYDDQRKRCEMTKGNCTYSVWKDF